MRIRKANRDDSARCADVHILARQQMIYLPKTNAAGAHRWMQGYASFAGGFLTNLYIHPDHQRRGIGSALLAQVKAYAPEGFKLWTFQQNEDAIRFYERHGFRSLKVTDGKDNMERVPDRLMAWQPTA